MIIYFAGNITPPREEILIKYKADRLYSYHYHGAGKEFSDEFELRVNKINDNQQTR